MQDKYTAKFGVTVLSYNNYKKLGTFTLELEADPDTVDDLAAEVAEVFVLRDSYGIIVREISVDSVLLNPPQNVEVD
jgi:hypothetical protein